MINFFKKTSLTLLPLSIMSCVSYTPIALDEERFAKAEITEDFDAFIEFVKTTHPDIEYSTDLSALDTAVEQVREALQEGATMREAWMSMALVNPVFGDAHIGLRRPVEALAAYEAEGGVLFPASVVFDGDGLLRIAPSASQDLGFVVGDEIVSINGVLSTDIVTTLMPRMRGESEALRKLILELYFPQYFWIAYGGFEDYAVRVRRDGRIKVVQPRLHTSGDYGDSEEMFSYETLDAETGYLNVKTFNIEYEDQFTELISDAFIEIQNAGVKNLIIDLRENGGGAHDVSDVLMGYLTEDTYSSISRVTARITEENVNRIPGAKLGDVVTVPFQLPVTPEKDNPLRFTGNVYALVGALTYSQAIAFATTLQDFDIAVIAGEETEGPANQTGQVQLRTLPNTGLEALAPIYIFTRANGDTSRRGVIPDIAIENDPLDPMHSVRMLLTYLE